jgi:hypothetical protein
MLSLLLLSRLLAPPLRITKVLLVTERHASGRWTHLPYPEGWMIGRGH